MVRHGVIRVPLDVAHGNAARRSGREINVVVSHAVPHHGPQRGRRVQKRAVHAGPADEQTGGAARECRLAGGIELISRKHVHPVPRTAEDFLLRVVGVVAGVDDHHAFVIRVRHEAVPGFNVSRRGRPPTTAFRPSSPGDPKTEARVPKTPSARQDCRRRLPHTGHRAQDRTTAIAPSYRCCWDAETPEPCPFRPPPGRTARRSSPNPSRYTGSAGNNPRSSSVRRFSTDR